MSLTEQINTALSNVILFLCEHPLSFVSESDIHMLIMKELMNIPEINPNTLYPTACTIGLNQYGKPSQKTYKTMRIHKEYGHADLDNARSDIVIFNPADIAKITDPRNLKTGKSKYDYIIPDYILEFGTEKAAGSESVFEAHLKNDIEKVNKSKIQGYIIHIQRNVVGAQGLENNRQKYRQYAKVVHEEYQNAKAHVKMVMILLNIGNPNRVIKREGKVRIYKDNKFKGINKKHLKEEIDALLR
ncbi:MAG: hypothetical protein D3916_16395 [Candidatus Electrothrix sp. MAN1_4]|nr:hypothetical protein [Candidatus Electrothrix sp. MAN1_4]